MAARGRPSRVTGGLGIAERIDKSGRPVGFYPSARSLEAARTQTSANVVKSGKPKENPATNPYKRPGDQ
jgi:hypothetical protein